MEVSIVSTSLVSITDDFHGFGQTSWLITAYLSTYTGRYKSLEHQGGGSFGTCRISDCVV